jgi:Flp pilus assembly protein TadG
MSQSISRYFQGRWAGILGHCRRVCGDSGNAVLEFAVIMAFLAPPLLLGTTDLAVLVYSSIEISNAAHAGAMYGMTNSNLASATAMIQIVAQNEASDFGTNLVVTPTTYYACSADQGGAQYPTTTAGLAAAAAACPSSATNHYLEFLQVVASAPVTLPFSCCGLPKTTTLTRTSVMEVE